MQQRVMKQVVEAQQAKADEHQQRLAKCTAIMDKLRAILLQKLGAANLKAVGEPYVNINMERDAIDNYVRQGWELKTCIGPNVVIRITLHTSNPDGVKAERVVLEGAQLRAAAPTAQDISTEWFGLRSPAHLAVFVFTMACWTTVPERKDFPKFKATPKKKATRKQA